MPHLGLEKESSPVLCGPCNIVQSYQHSKVARSGTRLIVTTRRISRHRSLLQHAATREEP